MPLGWKANTVTKTCSLEFYASSTAVVLKKVIEVELNETEKKGLDESVSHVKELVEALKKLEF